MENIIIRDKYNKKINSKHKKEIKNITFQDNFKYIKVKKNNKLASETFHNFKYFFDFNHESNEFLKEVEDAIKKLNLRKLLNLCDSSELRFFKIYDYIYNNISINENYNEYYDLFQNLIKKGKTTNSLNLGLYIISFINKQSIINFCKNIISDDLDYIEITTYILKNSNELSNNNIYNMFINYYSNKNVFTFLNGINLNKESTYKDFIISFYIFDISNIDLEKLSDFQLETFFTYVFNLKNAVDYIVNKLLMNPIFSEFKQLVKDVDNLFNKLEKMIDLKTLNYLSLDYKIFMFYAKFFKGFKEHINEETLNGIFEDLVSSILNKNYKKGKKIIQIYNKLDINISDRLFEDLKDINNFVDVCNSTLRICKDYKYFSNIINNMEKSFYITELIKNNNFRITLIRNLYIYYDNLNFDVIGSVFLKSIMEYEEYYYESKEYINLILEEILERTDN